MLPTIPKRNYLQGVDLDEGNLAGTAEQIGESMRKYKLKNLDIFQQFDADGDNRISSDELADGLLALGLHVPRRALKRCAEVTRGMQDHNLAEQNLSQKPRQ